MLRSMMVALIVFAVATSASADPPAATTDLVELRQQVGETGTVIGDDEQFAQALGRIANEATRTVEASDRVREAYVSDRDPSRPDEIERRPPVLRERAAFGESPIPPGVRPGLRSGPPVGPPVFANGPPPRHAGGHRGDHHGHYGVPHPPAPPRPESPKRLLRESAFELDRLAHGLENAELYGEADALRDAAEKLRRSARQSKPKKDGGSSGEKTPPRADKRSQERKLERGPREARKQIEAMKAEGRRIKEQAKAAQQQAKKAILEAEKAKAEAMKAREAQRRAEDQQETGAKRSRALLDSLRRRFREERERRDPEPVPLKVELPPPGIHGGPTGPEDRFGPTIDAEAVEIPLIEAPEPHTN